MVNQIILNYIKTYYGKYPLEALKKKVLASGYKKEELDEVLRILGLEKKEAEQRVEQKVSEEKKEEKIEVKTGTEKEEKKETIQKKIEPARELVKKEVPHYSPLYGFRWFKNGGVCGIILFVVGLVFSALMILLKEASLAFFLKPIGFIILVIGFIMFFIVFFAFFFAFFKLGELLEIKYLKRSSLIIILTPVIIFMISFLILFLIWNQISSFIGGIFVNEFSLPLMPMTGMVIGDGILSSFAKNLSGELELAPLGIGMAIVYCFIWFFVLVSNLFFGLGLAKVKEISLAKFTGIFHILAYGIFSLSIIISLILILIKKTYLLIDNFSAFVGVIFGSFALVCLVTLLEAIFLFKVSDIFEKDEKISGM